jgi:hypothetical protein
MTTEPTIRASSSGRARAPFLRPQVLRGRDARVARLLQSHLDHLSLAVPRRVTGDFPFPAADVDEVAGAKLEREQKPARPPDSPPAAWTLALRFVGDGVTMDGPGNLAIDGAGSPWVTNNYTWSPDPDAVVCGSKFLLRFTPTGQYVEKSPYRGGGINGAGYGITLDPTGNVWVGNFGFSSPGCSDPPPANSVSKFSPDGTALSPDHTGYTQGAIDWPQGTVSDQNGNIRARPNPAAARRYQGQTRRSSRRTVVLLEHAPRVELAEARAEPAEPTAVR